ncbi:uncharacterized protein LOC123543972 [Mercenaria mercenaria]|uniref:uncharacterized protein LOC123543972 n=1 Tax=Mercenaria mercenaria TaxID=6596 RepID=UPI00234EED96|nr:uncharacterized protein LOC123543972 [Mercenaria mercenaria]
MSSKEATNEDANTLTSFTEKGLCRDEVKLVFDDERELFVSENFLSLSSPVFKAMFSNDFIEKNEMTVRLPGKSYDDFLEFLMCIHPAVQKPIDESNAVRVVSIAAEYQVPSITAKCQRLMKTVMNKDLEEAKKASSMLYNHVVVVRKCLIFFNTAAAYGYKSLIEHCTTFLASFPSAVYTDSTVAYTDVTNCSYLSNSYNYKVKVNGESVNVKDVRSECMALFKKLPPDVSLMVITKRLSKCDTQKFL